MSYAAAKTRSVDIARRVFQSRVVIIGQLRGTNTPETNQMRFQLSKTGGSLKFIKNSMARVAAKEFPDRVLLGNLLHGKTILIYSDAEDPIATFKVIKRNLAESRSSCRAMGSPDKRAEVLFCMCSGGEKVRKGARRFIPHWRGLGEHVSLIIFETNLVSDVGNLSNFECLSPIYSLYTILAAVLAVFSLTRASPRLWSSRRWT